MKYCLAIDIGASSGRHILAHLEGGKPVLEEIYRFDNGYVEKNGRFYWDVDRLFENVVNGIKKCAEIGKIPESIGIDTWGVDYALLDKDGKIIDGVIAYRDPRTEKIPEEVYKIVSKRELYEHTGIAEHTFNTIFQLFEDKKSGRINGAADMLFIPCYLNYLLTGVKMNEYTFASTTGLLDVEKRDWDFEIIKKLGLPEKIFSKIHQPGEVVGTLKKEIAGFECKVILPPCHDTASAVVAVQNHEALWISSGTWSLIGTELETPCVSVGAEAAGFTNEGGLDGRIRFLQNIMGLWIIQSIKRELSGKYNYQELMLLAEKSNYKGILNVNDNSLLAPASMITAVKECLKKQGEPEPADLGDLLRAVYEGLADCYAKAADGIEKLTGRKFDTIVIVGGGSRDELLTRLAGERSGRKTVKGETEATAYGNLLVQFGIQ